MKKLLTKKQIGFLLIWTSIHLIILTVYGEYYLDSDSNSFWPMTTLNIDWYDGSEFIVYTIVPALWLGAYNLLRKS